MAKVVKKNDINMFEPAVKVKLPINKKDIPLIQAELKRCKNEPGFPVMLDSYTGPATGLQYNDKTKKLEIVSGWHVDNKGYIVKDVVEE
ncbi:MAG: hypothetical protein Q4B86_07080 [Eubacteriales bacterium]|nr:hypothetical protein [Eubacteriales bacterium]